MTGPHAARFAAAAALRDLGHALVAYDADDEALERVAEVASALADELRGGRRRDKAGAFASLLEGLNAAVKGGERQDAFADRAVAGHANPMALPLEFRPEGDHVVTDVVVGPAFEGAPGQAHGGIVAAIFDDLTGVIPAVDGAIAFTARLTVNFLSPVPVETPVEFRAWLEGREGRKTFVRAEARHGDAVIATAEALFVTVDLTRLTGAEEPSRAEEQDA